MDLQLKKTNSKNLAFNIGGQIMQPIMEEAKKKKG